MIAAQALVTRAMLVDTPNRAAKALAQGGAITLESLVTAGAFYETYVKSEGARLILSCTGGSIWMDDSRVIDRSYVPTIDDDDVVRFDIRNTEPKAGQVALCAYYDGWNYDVRCVLFRQGTKGLEGWNRSLGDWIPARRFRVVGVLVRHEVKVAGLEASWSDPTGLDFTDETVARARESLIRRRLVKSIVDRDQDAPISHDRIAAALGDRYEGPSDYPGAFLVRGDVRGIPNAPASVASFTRFYFPNESVPSIPKANGQLCLVAWKEGPDRDYEIGLAKLEEEDGKFRAVVDYQAPIRPEWFRYLRPCVGGENPDGVLL